VFFFSLYAYFLFGNHVAIIWNKRLELNITVVQIATTVGIYLEFHLHAVISRYAIKIHW
jgi:hypothetical protein